MIPHQYRTVAFTEVAVPLTDAALRTLLLSRQVYRRTRFVVAHSPHGDVALVEVTTVGDGLFVDVTETRMLAAPSECQLIDRPDLDTAVPSQLARARAEADLPSGVRCLVVRGTYAHVNFLLDEPTRRVHVLDVAPPWPAKLFDQAERVLSTGEELPAMHCVPQVVDLEELAAEHPADHYLLPCRGGGMNVPGARISYLDEVPPAAAWLQLGCPRSQAIHDHFYPDQADAVARVDICPAHLARSLPLPAGEVRLTKCCLLEEHVETRGATVVVPWGSSFTLVGEGLARAAALADEFRASGETPGQ
ncbi:DUF7714 family protein [Nocardioides daejeonensis]|uniref:DUF7714 family protein n=1 Tax=Nocardioides daejeonensis TaxID=1046556 RepID=UPI000D74B6E3|nr:hypothetical protein [Nocardioides daejeonensis]